jgi:hypothetical protein
MLTVWKSLFQDNVPMEKVITKREEAIRRILFMQSLRQNHDQLVSGEAEPSKDGFDTTRVADVAGVGGGAVRIPQRRAPEDALRMHPAAAVADPRPPRVLPPKFLLDCTVENTADLSGDEVAQLLTCQRGSEQVFDLEGLVYMLFLPNGRDIAIQLVNKLPGDFLLALLGNSESSRLSFIRMLFRQDYFRLSEIQSRFAQDGRPKTRDEMVRECMWDKCKSFLSAQEFGRRADVLVQAAVAIYDDPKQLRRFEKDQQQIGSLIASKFPPLDDENQEYWGYIWAVIESERDKLQDASEDVRARFESDMSKLPLHWPRS